MTKTRIVSVNAGTIISVICNQARREYFRVRLKLEVSASSETIPLNLIQIELMAEEKNMRTSKRIYIKGPPTFFCMRANMQIFFLPSICSAVLQGLLVFTFGLSNVIPLYIFSIFLSFPLSHFSFTFADQAPRSDFPLDSVLCLYYSY